jgi:hypothetical protein
MRQKPPYIICFFFILYILTLTEGCEKEYSYEGGPIPDSTTIRDSTVIQDSTKPIDITFPYCNGCNNIAPSDTLIWSFKVGSSLLCGNIIKGVLSPGGDGITFSGPSTCNDNTSLTITALFYNTKLNKDQSNLTASQASLEYYDNITMDDILQSKRSNFFSLTIDNYVLQTGVASGTFNGSVFDKNGNIIKVDAGKFSVKF